MRRIKIGSKVSTEAWRFDQRTEDPTHRWSFEQYGEKWRDARVCGIVMEKVGQKWLVKWEDNDQFAFETFDLCLEANNDQPVSRAEQQNVDDFVESDEIADLRDIDDTDDEYVPEKRKKHHDSESLTDDELPSTSIAKPKSRHDVSTHNQLRVESARTTGQKSEITAELHTGDQGITATGEPLHGGDDVYLTFMEHDIFKAVYFHHEEETTLTDGLFLIKQILKNCTKWSGFVADENLPGSAILWPYNQIRKVETVTPYPFGTGASTATPLDVMKRKLNEKFWIKKAKYNAGEQQNLASHHRIHTGEKPFDCTVCGKKFSQQQHLVTHHRIHTGEKPFDCTVCGKKFSQKQHLTSHHRIHTGEKPFDCTVCGKKFSHSQNLATHHRIHTGDKPFDCTVCGKKFSQQHGLVQHHRTHTGEKPFDCTVCGKIFSYRQHLASHHRIHTGEKPFDCTVCGKKFSRSQNLASHHRIHTGDKPFDCTVCGKKFSQQRDLAQHHRTHTGEKPFDCTVCGKKFSRQHHLASHHRIHTGDKPFDCTVCGKKFSHQGSIALHLRIHTGDNPFDCTVCGKKFSRQHRLASHHQIHTGEKAFECEFCAKSFAYKSSLKKHQVLHS